MSVLTLPVDNFTNSGLKSGTTAGIKAVVEGVSGKELHFGRINGYSDAATLVELRATMTGTIATTSGSANIVGTNTDFENEFVVGDNIRGTTNDELFVILTITDATNIVAVSTASNTLSSQAIEKVLEVVSCAVANQSIGEVAGNHLEIVKGITGKDISAKIMTSSSLCKLTLYGGYTS